MHVTMTKFMYSFVSTKQRQRNVLNSISEPQLYCV